MNFYIGNYWYLLLLLLLPVVGYILLSYTRWRTSRRSLFAEERFREMLFPKNSGFSRVFPALYLLAFLLLILSLIDVLGGTEEVKSQQKVGNVIFLLDVSNSMNAEDIQPNRLTEAKNIMIATLPKLAGDRVGVVVFAGEATSIMPLTSDLSAAETYIGGVETSVVKIQGTDFLKAMQVAVSKFKNIAKGSRQVVLISDGEDNEGHDEQAANLAQKEGIAVTSVGVGTEQGAPVPEYIYGQLMGYKTDLMGTTVVSKRQENALKAIASKTGGAYIDGNNLEDAAALVAENLSKKTASSVFVKSQNAIHYYQYFLAVALVLFLVIYLFNPKRDFNL